MTARQPTVACPSSVKRILIQLLGDEYTGFVVRRPQGTSEVHVAHENLALRDKAHMCLKRPFATKLNEGTIVVTTRTEPVSVLPDYLVLSHSARVGVLRQALAERWQRQRERKRYNKTPHSRFQSRGYYDKNNVRYVRECIAKVRKIREAIAEYNVLCPDQPIVLKTRKPSP